MFHTIPAFDLSSFQSRIKGHEAAIDERHLVFSICPPGGILITECVIDAFLNATRHIKAPLTHREREKTKKLNLENFDLDIWNAIRAKSAKPQEFDLILETIFLPLNATHLAAAELDSIYFHLRSREKNEKRTANECTTSCDISA